MEKRAIARKLRDIRRKPGSRQAEPRDAEATTKQDSAQSDPHQTNAAETRAAERVQEYLQAHPPNLER